MSEITPPLPPDPSEIPPPVPAKPPGPPLNKVAQSAIGAGLFIGSGLLCLLIPPFFLVGLIGAIASLFFPGYRLIFVGYISTLGLLLLGATIYCFAHPLRID
jgi:hypothetical protein